MLPQKNMTKVFDKRNSFEAREEVTMSKGDYKEQTTVNLYHFCIISDIVGSRGGK